MLEPRSDWSPFNSQHVALISAHYDDEILGAGGQLATMRRVSLIHLTNSAPSNRAARAHGFRDRQAYGKAREVELHNALTRTLAGTDTVWECFSLGLRDGMASFHMAKASRELSRLLLQLQPDLVLTQPYEGGHADHDTAAFVTHSALRRSGLACPLWEMTSYHRVGGAVSLGDFLPFAGAEVIGLKLNAEGRARKASALACFVSQRAVVSQFPLLEEKFRLAPEYDFFRPPHPGRLHYEARRRAMTSRFWRALAFQEAHRRPLPSLIEASRNALWRLWLAN